MERKPRTYPIKEWANKRKLDEMWMADLERVRQSFLSMRQRKLDAEPESGQDIARRRVAIASGQAVPNQVPLISVDRPWSAARHASIVALRKPAVAAHTLN